MTIKFEKIKSGMMLYDRHRERAGNTTMRRLGEWTVQIVSLNAEQRSAQASWNGNPATTWFAHDLEKLSAWSMYDKDVIREGVPYFTTRCRKKTKTELAAEKAHPCEYCGSVEDVTFGPDPYDEDINNDLTPHWICTRCNNDRAADI